MRISIRRVSPTRPHGTDRRWLVSTLFAAVSAAAIGTMSGPPAAFAAVVTHGTPIEGAARVVLSSIGTLRVAVAKALPGDRIDPVDGCYSVPAVIESRVTDVTVQVVTAAGWSSVASAQVCPF